MPVPALPITRNLKRKSEQMCQGSRERKTQGIKGKIERKKKPPKQKQPYIMNSKTLLFLKKKIYSAVDILGKCFFRTDLQPSPR